MSRSSAKPATDSPSPDTGAKWLGALLLAILDRAFKGEL